jgi:hypothetical protein
MSAIATQPRCAAAPCRTGGSSAARTATGRTGLLRHAMTVLLQPPTALTCSGMLKHATLRHRLFNGAMGCGIAGAFRHNRGTRRGLATRKAWPANAIERRCMRASRDA